MARVSGPAKFGIWAAILTLVLDQATKLPLIRILDAFGPAPGRIRLGPMFELIVVWNRGISYGLFQQHSDLGRWLLVAVSIVAAVALTIWMLRAPSRLLALSLGLIVGGAIGNVIDRLAYAAVFDFAHLHWGGWSWYVFNLADAAIVAGVVGLLYDSLIAEGRRQSRA